MRILLLGATGRTGIKIIEEANKVGYEISAIARNPEKIQDYGVDITQGSPYDYSTVEKAIVGCDAVINTLNVSRKSGNPWSALIAPKDMISKSATNVIKAMEKEGISRYIAMSAIGAGRSWQSTPLILRIIVSVSNLKFAFLDHGNQEKILEDSNIDYTICRAPMLSDKKSAKGATATAEGVTPASPVLSRDAAAEFFLNIIKNNSFVRETISLANVPN